MKRESIYRFSARAISGLEQDLEAYRGQVLLIVNVASKCGFTPQYEGLQELYARYRERGLTVLGFPCNQFMGQEPGDEDEIQQFCATTFGVDFPMFSKVDVNGPETHPLYAFLKEEAPGALGTRAIKWNFTKFLVDRDGRVVKRFAPKTTPQELVGEIEALLEKGSRGQAA